MKLSVRPLSLRKRIASHSDPSRGKKWLLGLLIVSKGHLRLRDFPGFHDGNPISLVRAIYVQPWVIITILRDEFFGVQESLLYDLSKNVHKHSSPISKKLPLR